MLLLWAILATATGAGGWWLWQQQQDFASHHSTQIAQLERSQHGLNEHLQSLEGVIATLQRERSEWTETVNDLTTELIHVAQAQQQQSRDTAADTLLEDVAFLLRTARHIALLSGDLTRAEQLLEQANQQLQASQRLALLPVREALNQDLQELRRLPRTDTDELYLQLGALAHEAQQWQWWPTERLSFQATPSMDTSASGWHAIWAELRTLVRLHERTDQRFEALDTASFEQARNQYRLFLLQAQSALLQGQQTPYEYSLEQATAWLEYLAESIPNQDGLMTQLQALTSASVVRQTPDIRRALDRLQQLQEANGGGDGS
jgi:uroporphyrin-3 C-methyltransferase